MLKLKLLLGVMLLCPAAMAVDVFSVYTKGTPENCVDKDINTKEMVLADIVEIGICRNPDLKVGYMQLKSAQGAYGSAQGEYLPDIEATGSVYDTYDKYEGSTSVGENPYAGDITLSWLIYDFGGRGARIDSAKSSMDAMLFSYNALLNNTVLSINTAYFDLLSNSAVLKSAKSSEKTVQKAYEESARKFELGMASLSDKLLAKTSLEQAKLDVLQADNDVKLAQSVLATLLNLAPSTKFSLKPLEKDADIISLNMGDMSVDDMIEVALSKRPEIKTQESQVRYANNQVDVAKSANYPSISFNAGIGYDDDFVHAQAYGHNRYVGASVSVPLFTGFSNSYTIKQAKSDAKKEQYTLQSTTDSVKNEVWQSYHNYHTAVQSYAISQEALNSAVENERVSFASYQVGQGNMLTLLTANEQLASARKDVVLAYYGVLKSKVSLYRAIGQF